MDGNKQFKTRMNLRIIPRCVVVWAVILTMATCGSKNETDPGNGSTTESTINGTTIQEGNNLAGLIKDAKTGKGIPDVPVTDGFKYVKTDANGVYQMKAATYCRNVYYSLPADYEVCTASGAPSKPLFFSTSRIDRNALNRNDFTLTPRTSPNENFTLLMIGDPQCKTDSDVNRWKSETIPDIQQLLSSGSYGEVYAMTLGDIIFDKTEQWPAMEESMAGVRIGSAAYLPIFNCIGNHDHDASEQNDFNATRNYVNAFGPTDYSFNIGKVHVVVMDDVIVTTSTGSTWNYNGGFTASQMNWLKQDLALVADKSDKMVIFCTHIPFRGNKDNNYPAVLNLLTQFKEAHLMIGHTHYNQNYIHPEKAAGGQKVYEHIHGAACGAWWSCNSNVTGAPNGYSIYRIEGSRIVDWVIKGTNKPLSEQMRVYNGNQVFYEGGRYPLVWSVASQKAGPASITVKGNASFKDCFVAEVFGDDSVNWTVELFQDGAKIGDFTRISDGASCNVAASSFFFNQLNKNTATWANITASHYWYCRPASGTPADAQGWEVRATQTIPSSGKQNVYSCSTLTTSPEAAF